MHGVYENGLSGSGYSKFTTPFVDTLRAQGYTTALIGKAGYRYVRFIICHALFRLQTKHNELPNSEYVMTLRHQAQLTMVAYLFVFIVPLPYPVQFLLASRT